MGRRVGSRSAAMCSSVVSLAVAGALALAGCSGLPTGVDQTAPATDIVTATAPPAGPATSDPGTSDPAASESATSDPASSTSSAAPAMTSPPITTATSNVPSSARRALAVLATLPVKGRAPKTGYSREQFGAAWTDDVSVAAGHNGCDTRNDILRRDLTALVLKPGSNGCSVRSGVLADPYTGSRISFVRGEDTSADVQIDHVVSLSDAWQTGAQQLTAAERQDFANDPRNLQATDGPTNERKSDSDAASWLPPRTSYRCTYVARQVAVKAAYRLWVTSAERDAMRRILSSCNTISLPRPVPAPDRNAAAAPSPTPTVTPTQPLGLMGGGAVYYRNCAAARAAGAAPLHRGDPGYRPGLDRDHDGIACE